MENSCKSQVSSDSQSDSSDPNSETFLSKFLSQFSLVSNAILTAFLFSIFTIFSLPVFLYRFVLSNIIVPHYFSDRIGRPVTPTGNIFASEFLGNYPPRCAVVTNIVMEGTSNRKEVWDTIKTNWIDKTTFDKNANENAFFPELKQYVESWMGFMFWKQDMEFNLNNHLIFHEIPKSKNDDVNSEKYVCSLMEELINKPFYPKRSPWEIHMIQNYTNSELSTEEGKELTVFMFRFHHALADGFSILYAIVEGLFGTPLSEIDLPSTDTVTLTPEYTFGEAMLEILSITFDFCMRSAKDLNYLHSLICRPRTAWHVSDRRKTWKQLYARSPLIPVDKIKFIKEKYGVSFTGVLFSCISAGISKSLNKESDKGETESLPTLIPLPLTGHPLKLKNHVTGTIFDLPVKSNLQPACRLMECEKRLQMAKKTTIPYLGVIYSKVVGSHFAPVAQKLLKNSVIPMGLSNFPGPKSSISWKGREGLTADFAAGAITGVAGVGFMVFSYRNHMRIATTAENAVMNRNDLEAMITQICQEIEILENSASMIRRRSALC